MVLLMQSELDFLVISLNIEYLSTNFTITGLKILLTCFEKDLDREGSAINRALKKFGREGEPTIAFWKLIDFVNAKKGPLYTHFIPYIKRRVRQTIEL